MIHTKNFTKFDFILIDLDNTIYPEIIFLNTAYKRIGKELEAHFRCDSKEIHNYLVNEFKNCGRNNLFDKLFEKFSISIDALDLVLTTMRNTIVDCPIPLYPEAKSILLQAISNKKKVFVITNGNIIQQMNKVKSIDWNDWVQHLVIIYANNFEPKPCPNLYNQFLSVKYNLNNNGIMIGDSIIDEVFAHNIGLPFYHAYWHNYL